MLICERIKENFKSRKRKLFGEYNFVLTDKIDNSDKDAWNAVNRDRNLFLSPDYLRLLESSNGNCRYKYVIVYNGGTPAAVFYFQVIDFTSELFGEMVTAQLSNLQSTRVRLFQKYIDQTRGKIVLRVVTLGNNFVSGEHGFIFSKDLSKGSQIRLLHRLADIISKEEKLRGRISATLVKDFFEDTVPAKNELVHDHYIEFTAEPNMIVEIPAEAQSLSDYVSLFSKKYRKRAKTIFSMCEGIEKRELSAEEVQKHNKEIFSLYEQVYNKAKFKLVKLPKNYFPEAKKSFGERFIVRGFFSSGKLIAFSSGFLLGNSEVEAHFIGFDYELNKELELYQNILYGFIDLAILNNCKRVNLGRTAAEIKSTIGAKPKNLICYLKPQNTVSKMVMRPFISYLQPGEWVPRNPFKEETATV